MTEEKDLELKEEEVVVPEPQEEGVEEDDQDAPIGQVDEADEIDYKAELEKTKEVSNNYKKGMLIAKEENKKLKAKKDDIDDWDLDDDDDESEDIDEKISSKVNERMSELLGDAIEETLTTMTDNPDERELIKYHYENTLNKTGLSKRNIQDDLLNAKALANRRRIVKENKELKLAMRTKNGISNTGIGTNALKPSVNTVKLTKLEKVLFDRTNERRIARGMKALKASEFKN